MVARNWYPVTDYEKCTGRLTCFNFCPHGVYGLREDGKPLVVNPDDCVELCRGCQKIYPGEAIRYNGDIVE
ncbi:MAG: 4Fe-4S dicluster domain-containing protein [Thermosphaera aggregans]|jgi:NAD-dependent dihydropyrimidine dehydrogenase PreA subunit|uniref:4Fe-4S dicluster domain-containing protein n=1 Tax=Thermosphaera aggregans TaxID=54254 RepID=UPI003BFF492D